MKNRFKKMLSLGLSALMLTLVLTSIVPSQPVSTAAANTTNVISPLSEDPPW